MRKFHFATLAGLALFFAACQGGSSENATATPSESEDATEKTGQAFIGDESSKPNALQIAIGSADHSTLVAAVQAAGVENALVNVGPLTVFAPTNAAFDALPAGTVDNLLKPENKDVLANILKHHVSAGNYDKEFLKKFKKVSLADGTDAAITIEGDDVFIGGAKIIASVPAGNGIVHVVDAVILPATK